MDTLQNIELEKCLNENLNASKLIIESLKQVSTKQVNTKQEDAIKMLLNTVKKKTQEFISTLNSLIEDKEANFNTPDFKMIEAIEKKIAKTGTNSLNSNEIFVFDSYQNYQDLSVLENIKEAMEDGIIISACAGMAEINDIYTHSIVVSDFRELAHHADECDVLLQKNSDEQNLNLSNSLQYINKKGTINFKEIKQFNKESFHDIYTNIIQSKEESQEQQSAVLPAFEEEINHSMTLK